MVLFRAGPIHSLTLLALVLLAFTQVVSASFASIKAQQDKQKDKPVYGGQEIVPGSFLIEVGGGSLSKRAGGAAVSPPARCAELVILMDS